MAQKPIDGGSYFRDEAGNLVKLEEGQYQLDPETRELKRPESPKPQATKAEQTAVPAPKK
jgi:hypothetical protein